MTDHRPPLLLAALRDPSPDAGAEAWLARILRAERAGADAVVLDGFPLDAMLLAALAATRTERVGLVPLASTTLTEPFHVSTRLATIDFASGGRTGWLVTTTPAPDAAGAVTWDVPPDVVADATEHVAAVRGLWDSWETGAEIRDVAAGRFLDRAKVHHVHQRGAHIAVRGPSITPRPPQGHPVVMAHDPGIGGVDVVLAASAPAGRRWVLDATEGDPIGAVAGAAGDAAGVLVDGEEDLPALVAELDRLGLRPAQPRTGTLRDRFGLPPAAARAADRPAA